ncbi:MAG TPA: cbb3-type cytochrome c oxidase subunit II [Bryobacteraceae bacterium]|nr:cbb3-type cytochrome c oxidase subunit II [Bryobacteraceae bacterium]
MNRDIARFLRMSYMVASIGGVAFFAMSVALLGIWPGRVLEEETRRMSPPHPLGLSISEQRGRVIYSREGCAYCHSQQVRYLHSDMARYGAPTLAWETRFDYPHLWGTRRIGPDLAREGGVHTEDWQFAHLYAPRNLVMDSVMPAFPLLFDGSPDRPRQEARDLVAYLETLGRARELAGPEGEEHARSACNCADDEMSQMAFEAAALNANPARARRQGATPELLPAANLGRGRDLYAHNCASCHGVRGEADGPGSAGLHPRPANLAEHEYSAARVSYVLWNGVAGTSMQAWRDLSSDDRAALVQVVRGFYAPQTEPALPADLTDLGARVYAANCSQCHGEHGAGDGSAVAELRMIPTDFRNTRPSIAESLRALRNGVEGTQMAPWTARLSEAELSAVAYYVRGFFGRAQ